MKESSLSIQQKLLEVSDLHKRYRNGDGVRGVNLHVAAGEIVALVGPNGAGKTTTVRCVAGLLRPDRGSVLIAGARAGTTPAKARTAIVPDNPALYSVLTIEEHLRFRAQAFRVAGDIDAVIAEALRAVDMEDFAGRVGGELSRGQRQRVMLAAALVQDAALQVLDEPTVGLDPKSLSWLESWLWRCAGAGGGVLVTTHQLDFVARTATRAVLLRDGEIAESFDGPCRSGQSADDFRNRLISAFEG